MTSLLRAPHDIRRDRRRSETYLQTHELLRGYVNRKKEQEALDELERDIERILDDWRAGGLI
ncbi:hypothetical protein [Chelativorans sp. Marseille-P2723]|uniref:hypothetical protein n=1 Tax=Chelativorans sp. Marseille-P2723 TaxID=2709133 RepID=UPI00156D49F9|nr:hypothetical protein [Chelativorans sp. Marseille-P2723]